jgi:hypothetical protein
VIKEEKQMKNPELSRAQEDLRRIWMALHKLARA